MKQVAWFISGAVLSAGALALAAVGDKVYRQPPTAVEITAQQSSNIKTCIVTETVWDGVADDLERFELLTTGGKHYATTSGLKTVTPANIETTRQALGGEINIVGEVE